MISLNAVGAVGDDAMIFAGTVQPEPYLLAAADPVGIGAVMAMWQIFSSGQDRSASLIASALIEQGDFNLAAVKLEVVREVRVAYAQALAARGEDDAAGAAVQAAQELLRITDQRFQAGSVPEAFVLKSRANLAASERKKAMAEAAFAAKVAELKEAAAVSQTESLDLEDWQQSLQAPETLEAALQVSTQRPEINAAEAKRRELLARADSARQSQGPQVNLVGMGTGMATEFESDVFYKLGIVLSVPLVDGGMRRAEAAEMRAMAESAEQEIRTVRLRIDREVASAWADWQASPEAIRAGQAEVASAEEAYRIAKLRYSEGKAPQVEVEQAVADLVSALAGRAEANAFRRIAWANLMRAVGEKTDQEDQNKND
jgi:outer membrane protein TolC